MLNRLARRGLMGTAAGAVGGVALALTLSHPLPGFLLGLAIGAIYAIATLPTREGYVDRLMSGGALGIPLWGLFSVIAMPVLSGEMPQWGAAQMRGHFPALVGWILFGAVLAPLAKALDHLATTAFGPEVQPAPLDPEPVRNILILGGGFAGMRAAACLEEQFQGNPSVAITLVSETNALLFTPMLAEVAGGSLEPSHISTPLRSSLHRTAFIRGRVQTIDLERRVVELVDPEAGGEKPRPLTYDHLVLALGAVSNYLGMANVERLAFNFKTLLDAIRIRNHVIEMFERADREPDPAVRAAMLTFVVAGGGFAGVELAGAINDFTHGILADYPNLREPELRTVLVHSRDRILPELSESLARYALRKMEERGIQFRLNTRLTGAEPGKVLLGDTAIAAETLVWTAGTAPNPLLKSLPVEKDKRGAVVVDSTMAVPGHPGVWALGDCAALTDARRGTPCPPTAQYAMREAQALAANIHAAWSGRPGRPFHFDSLGALCVVGFQTACAELTLPFARARSIRFSGLLAWLMWRGIYLAKLPGVERKTRVLIDWAIELFFPRDIVQTIDLK
jgi:NADH dehydrogenase